MPQDRETGNRARRWGYENARRVAEHLGAQFINPNRSNEVIWRNRRILIKSAHYGNPEIGATLATLNRIEVIVAALQNQDNTFNLFEIQPQWFRENMRQSRSHGAAHVMMVKCSDVRLNCNMIGNLA